MKNSINISVFPNRKIISFLTTEIDTIRFLPCTFQSITNLFESYLISKILSFVLKMHVKAATITHASNAIYKLVSFISTLMPLKKWHLLRKLHKKQQHQQDTI